MNDLAQYAKDFGAFINSLLPSLPADAVTNLVTIHEQGLRAVVDALKARTTGRPTPLCGPRRPIWRPWVPA